MELSVGAQLKDSGGQEHRRLTRYRLKVTGRNRYYRGEWVKGLEEEQKVKTKPTTRVYEQSLGRLGHRKKKESKGVRSTRSKRGGDQ